MALFPTLWPSGFSTQGNPDWYDPAWLYRQKISISSSKVGSPLTNFPVFVRLDLLGSHFLSNVQHAGSEIRITNSVGSQVPREIVEVRNNGGEIHFLADSISNTTDTDFWIYYGNSSGSVDLPYDSTYGRNAVWTDYYNVVHFNELPGSIIDSTGSVEVGSALNYGAIPDENFNGSYGIFSGSSLYINGADRGINFPFPAIGQAPFSFMVWYKSTYNTSSNQSPIFAIGRLGTNYAQWQIRLDTSLTYPNEIGYFHQVYTTQSRTVPLPGSWFWDQEWMTTQGTSIGNTTGNGDLALYTNGSWHTYPEDIVSTFNISAVGSISYGDDPRLFSATVREIYFDEGRVRRGVIGSEQLKIEYDSVYNIESFLAVGSVQSIYSKRINSDSYITGRDTITSRSEISELFWYTGDNNG